MPVSILQALSFPGRRIPLKQRGISVQGCTQLLTLVGLPLRFKCTANASSTTGPVRTASEDPHEEPNTSARSSAPFRLIFGSAMIPHPDKAAKGGEDGWFISDDGCAFGVADGVGSWSLVGVDAGEYARQLMRYAQEATDSVRSGSLTPSEILVYAHSKTLLPGSSTALILTLDGSKLHAANVGDSGFMVVRNGKAVVKSPPQQKDFNFPFQLAQGGGDPPSCAERFSVSLHQDDIIVAGTDGLWDNVFPEGAAFIASNLQFRGKGPQDVADALAEYAVQRAGSYDDSPFSVGARRYGKRCEPGGKLDDITVVIARVAAASKL